MTNTAQNPGKRVAPEDSIAGIYAVTVGLFLFSIQDAIIKSFSGTYSVLQIVFTRSVMAVVLMLVVILVVAEKSALKTYKPWPIIFKGACGFFSYILYYMAIAGLPLADAATITFTAPIIVTALSAIFLKENVGWRRWCAVLLGFIAISLVVGPKGHFNNLYVVLALAAAFTYAVSTISTRYIDARDSAITAAFYSMTTFLVLSIVFSVVVLKFFESDENGPAATAFLLRRWQQPNELDQWLMISLGFIASGGFYMLVKAYMVGEFSAIAPFEYLYILWGAIIGFIIWQEIPSPTTLAGIALLVCSNLYVLRRELAIKKRNAFRRPRIPHR